MESVNKRKRRKGAGERRESLGSEQLPGGKRTWERTRRLEVGKVLTLCFIPAPGSRPPASQTGACTRTGPTG